MLITAISSIITTTVYANLPKYPEVNLIEPFPFEVKYQMKQVQYPHIVLNVKPQTMYATCETPIYDKPIADVEYIHDFSLVNTSFEVLDYGEKWSLISTEDGHAYILSENLSDTEVVVEPELKYTERELYLMAHLLAGECQPYSDMEQRRVGSVALNRVNHEKYPNTLEEVIFQKGQYACTWDGNFYREPTESNWANAKWLLENGSILPEHVVRQQTTAMKNIFYKSEWHYFGY